MNELKRCSCGGEPEGIGIHYVDKTEEYFVYCTDCRNQTKKFSSLEAAEKSWNDSIQKQTRFDVLIAHPEKFNELETPKVHGVWYDIVGIPHGNFREAIKSTVNWLNQPYEREDKS